MADPFDDPELAALIAESAASEEELALPKGPGATPASKDFLRNLLEKLNREGDYDVDDMSQEEVSDLIDECKSELGWD